MRINYKGKFSQIITAIEDANDILNSEEFYQLISNHGDFNCSDFSSEDISNIIKKSKLEVEVKIYKPRWRYSKVLGYFIKSKPNKIFLNSRKIYRDTNSITNTIIHEYVHAVDNDNNSNAIEFGHICQSFTNTAPYVIGSYAEFLMEGNATTEIPNLINALVEQNHMCIQEDINALDSADLFIIEEHRVL
ncbi:hypothetical protein DUT90_01980 [Polaribacter sp. WD7]|uniref:hypothetical protein n=1 Tax=Polaribacter sp. WD7 TaxID=2269061 RepID=UPI000DF463B5|nr:hypothetical protein [Polaribacter sp. WD7]RCS28100.1 hypothetical protein DUT90_01980 [Polaribacter sp. WD7]